MPCNHPTVKLNTQESNGVTTSWWACDFCQTLFVLQSAQTRPLTIRQLAEEIKDYASPKTPETFAAQPVNIEGIVDDDANQLFITNLEKRHMSSWSDDELHRYSTLTGQSNQEGDGKP